MLSLNPMSLQTQIGKETHDRDIFVIISQFVYRKMKTIKDV